MLDFNDMVSIAFAQSPNFSPWIRRRPGGRVACYVPLNSSVVCVLVAASDVGSANN